MLSGNHFYNSTTKKCVSVFGTLFNSIKILKPGSVEERVPLAYGPREKFLSRIKEDASLEDQKLAMKVPRMSFEITSIDYDSSLKLNRFNKKITAGPDELSKEVTIQSVPYNVGMQLNILGKTQDEVLQIFEQILPSFVPEYTVSVKDMEGPGKNVDVPVILNGASFTDDYEGDFTGRRTLVYSLEFTMKVRFFGETTLQPVIRATEVSSYVPPNDVEFSDAGLKAAKSAEEVNTQSGVSTELSSDTDTPDNHTVIIDYGFDATP